MRQLAATLTAFAALTATAAAQTACPPAVVHAVYAVVTGPSAMQPCNAFAGYEQPSQADFGCGAQCAFDAAFLSVPGALPLTCRVPYLSQYFGWYGTIPRHRNARGECVTFDQLLRKRTAASTAVMPYGSRGPVQVRPPVEPVHAVTSRGADLAPRAPLLQGVPFAPMRAANAAPHASASQGGNHIHNRM